MFFSLIQFVCVPILIVQCTILGDIVIQLSEPRSVCPVIEVASRQSGCDVVETFDYPHTTLYNNSTNFNNTSPHATVVSLSLINLADASPSGGAGGYGNYVHLSDADETIVEVTSGKPNFFGFWVSDLNSLSWLEFSLVDGTVESNIKVRLFDYIESDLDEDDRAAYRGHTFEGEEVLPTKYFAYFNFYVRERVWIRKVRFFTEESDVYYGHWNIDNLSMGNYDEPPVDTTTPAPEWSSTGEDSNNTVLIASATAGGVLLIGAAAAAGIYFYRKKHNDVDLSFHDSDEDANSTNHENSLDMRVESSPSSWA